MIRESSIKFEVGEWFVLETLAGYEVRRNGLCVSAHDSTYSRDPDGLSVAIARATYKAKTR